jgi:hypothetical protein
MHGFTVVNLRLILYQLGTTGIMVNRNSNLVKAANRIIAQFAVDYWCKLKLKYVRAIFVNV